MREVKSNEYVIATAGEGEDGYVYTKDLNEEVACLIRLRYEGKVALARNITRLQFLYMMRDLTSKKKLQNDEKLVMDISFIGGKACEGLNEDNPATKYIDRLIDLIPAILGENTELKQEQSIFSDRKIVYAENKELYIKFEPLQIGNIPHINSVIVNADSGEMPIQSYEEWEAKTFLGCSDNKRDLALKQKLERERKAYLARQSIQIDVSYYKKLLDESQDLKSSSKEVLAPKQSNGFPLMGYPLPYAFGWQIPPKELDADGKPIPADKQNHTPINNRG